MSTSPNKLRKPAFLSLVIDEPATPAVFAAATGRDRAGHEKAPVAAAAPHPTVPSVATEQAATLALDRVDMALRLLRSQGERLAEQARSDALELAFLVARRILEHEVS